MLGKRDLYYLEKRKVRSDMIEVCKIMRGVDSQSLFLLVGCLKVGGLGLR